MHEYRLPLVANIVPLCGISIAPSAQISIYLNIPSSTVAATTVPLLHKARQSRAGEGRCGCGLLPRRQSRCLFVTLSACHLSRYRKSLPHEDCFAIGGRSVWVRFMGRFYETLTEKSHKKGMETSSPVVWVKSSFDTFIENTVDICLSS